MPHKLTPDDWDTLLGDAFRRTTGIPMRQRLETFVPAPALRAPQPADPPDPPLATEDLLLQRILGTLPTTTVTVGQPLSAATLIAPVKHDFCVHCGIDLYENAEALVTGFDADTIRVRCSCARVAHIPVWLFR